MDNVKQAIIFNGEFAYNLGNIFASQLGIGLEHAGWRVTTLDLRDEEARKLARDPGFYREHGLVFAINAIRADPRLDNFRYYRDTGCVFVAMLIDPPLLQYPRLFFNNDILTCIDRSHIRFLERYVKDGISSDLRHLPHGGCRAENPPEPWEKRSYDVIFAGTFTDPREPYREMDALPRGLRQIFMEAAETLLANDNLTVFDALAGIMSQYGFDVGADAEAFQLLVSRYTILDRFIRAEKRLRALTALDHEGITVNIWGNNWPEKLFRGHRIFPPCPLNEINNLMTRARIVLDFGFYEDGSHERVFTAMLNGAVAVAGDNPYHRENFTDGKDICLYNFTDLPGLGSKIAGLLREDDKCRELAANGQLNAEQRHSWTHRAETVLEYVRQYRKNN